MRIIVTGGRDYFDKEKLFRVLDLLNPSYVAVGDCSTGADKFALEWCQEKNIQYKLYVADWEGLGRKAGPIRNQEMVETNQDCVCVAFPGGRGTANTVDHARACMLVVLQVS